MEAIAHSPEFAKKAGVPQSVGKDFAKADKGKKFKEGGAMKHDDIKEDKVLIKKAFNMHDKQLHENKKTDLTKLKKGGMTMKKMAMGGMSRMESKGEHPVQKRAKQGAEMVKMAEPKHKGYEGGAGVKMAKGGLAAGHKSADGCAVRGKTRAMAPGMKKGGKC